jgi:protein tyrosine/serine phosphatase
MKPSTLRLKMPTKPFPQSFWVHDELLCAGCYPGDKNPATFDDKLSTMLDCGVRRVVSLMEDDETDHSGQRFKPYMPRLQELAGERGLDVDWLNMPIRDGGVPDSATMTRILKVVEAGLEAGTPTYVHCWGGHGRTGTVVACHLIERGHTPQQAIEMLTGFRAGLPKNHYPFEGDQERFVRSWAASEQ